MSRFLHTIKLKNSSTSSDKESVKGILVVEDSQEVQLLLKKALRGIAGELVAVSTVKEARQVLATREFQLIILDISLPDEDGLQFCNELQEEEKTRSVPVMFLTGNTEVSVKVTAFSMGAEDFIEKPFNPLELRARVEAKIRKISAQQEAKQTLVRGKLQLDVLSQRAQIVDSSGSTKSVHLTPREFKLLFHLAKTEDRLFTRDQLLSAVWGDQAEVFDRTVDSHISSIRKKLGPVAHYIESVSGQGYRFSSVELKAKKSA